MPDCTTAATGRGTTTGAVAAPRFVLDEKLRRRGTRVAVRGRCTGPTGSVCNGRMELLRGTRRIVARTFSVPASRRMTFHARARRGAALRARAVTLQPGGGTLRSSRRYR